MAIRVESRGESYGQRIHSVGEVLKLDDAAREPNPINLDQRLARVSAGIHRLDGQLLIVVDVDRVLDISGSAIAA
jgi:purine-binding chemotaxis protein CheW